MATVDDIRALEDRILALKEQLAELRRTHRAADIAEIVGDYTFRRPKGEAVSLRTLFGSHDDLLVIHNMGRRCPYCSLWADALNGIAGAIQQRAGLVLISPDEPEVQAAFAAERGWTFPLASGAGTTFARDMGYERGDGSVLPGVSAFHRSGPDGPIVRTGTASFGPGDAFCPVWHYFDLLRDGSNGWQPR